MKKMLFIYNPNAGTGVLKPKLSDVLDIFVKAGYEVTAFRFPLLSSANRLYRFAAHNISPVFILLGYLALIAGCTGFPCSKNRSYHTRKM
jgi:diacylglycerol kinase family enzyme